MKILATTRWAGWMILLAVTGCTLRQTYTGSPLPREEAGRLVPGVDKAEVLERLGPPDMVGPRIDGCVFVYRYRDESDAGLSLSFFQASVSWDESDQRTHRLVLFFDKKGRLTAVARGLFVKSIGPAAG